MKLTSDAFGRSRPRRRRRLYIDRTSGPVRLGVPGGSALCVRDTAGWHRGRVRARWGRRRRRWCRRRGGELGRLGDRRRWWRSARRRRYGRDGTSDGDAGRGDREPFALVPVLVVVELLAVGLSTRRI